MTLPANFDRGFLGVSSMKTAFLLSVSVALALAVGTVAGRFVSSVFSSIIF